MVAKKRSFGEKFNAKFPSHMGFWTGVSALGATNAAYSELRKDLPGGPQTAGMAASALMHPVVLPVIVLDGAVRGAATAAISSAIGNQRRKRSKRRSRSRMRRRSRRSRR